MTHAELEASTQAAVQRTEQLRQQEDGVSAVLLASASAQISALKGQLAVALQQQAATRERFACKASEAQTQTP